MQRVIQKDGEKYVVSAVVRERGSRTRVVPVDASRAAQQKAGPAKTLKIGYLSA